MWRVLDLVLFSPFKKRKVGTIRDSIILNQIPILCLSSNLHSNRIILINKVGIVYAISFVFLVVEVRLNILALV